MNMKTKLYLGALCLCVLIVISLDRKSSHDTSEPKPVVITQDENSRATNAETATPVIGIEVKETPKPIDDFYYTIDGDTVVLDECNTRKSMVTIYPTYEIDGKLYTTDLSSFQVGIGDDYVDTIIFAEGITEVSTAVFNSSDVQRVYFPESMTNVYDYTLAYLHPEDEGRIQIYYAGSQEEWANIFTEYKSPELGDTEFGREMGAALADRVNGFIGTKYDSSEFEYYFIASPEDLQ